MSSHIMLNFRHKRFRENFHYHDVGPTLAMLRQARLAQRWADSLARR